MQDLCGVVSIYGIVSIFVKLSDTILGQCFQLQIYEIYDLIDKVSDVESEDCDLEYHCDQLMFSTTKTNQITVLGFRISTIPETCA